MKLTKKEFIATLMTKDDFRIGTKRILKELKKINKIMIDTHLNYHKNKDEMCNCKHRLNHTSTVLV